MLKPPLLNKNVANGKVQTVKKIFENMLQINFAASEAGMTNYFLSR